MQEAPLCEGEGLCAAHDKIAAGMSGDFMHKTLSPCYAAQKAEEVDVELITRLKDEKKNNWLAEDLARVSKKRKVCQPSKSHCPMVLSKISS
jgi:hypothetical protein